jgi:hypothetical protein
MSTPVDQAFQQLGGAVGGAQVDPTVGNQVIAALSTGGHELRVWVDTANEFGHHSTTMNMLKRIIGFGFTGAVRVFVDTADAAKLELFLPGYTAGAAQLVYRGVTIDFQYTGTPEDLQPLLICGGSEAKPEELQERLALANCSYYLQLQPWNWKSIDRLFYTPPPTTVTLDGQPTLGGAQYSFCAYTEQAPVRDDPTWDLYGALARFTTRVAMAKLIADAAAGKYLQPTYGLGSRSDKWTALLTLILGGLATQDVMANVGLPVQPVILLVFDSMEAKDWPELQRWLDGTSDDEDYPEELRAYVTTNNLVKRLGLQYTNDVKLLKDQLSYLTGNRLLVVAMPSCPDEIFRYFYGAATLPCVFEGRGTQNLVLNTGQPYLCTSPEGYPSPAFDAHTPPAATAAVSTVKQLQRLPSAYANADATQFPSNLYANALCALLQNANATAYFQALGTSYRNPARDKLRMALRYLRSVPGWEL